MIAYLTGIFIIFACSTNLEGNKIDLQRKLPADYLSCWNCHDTSGCINLNKSAIQEEKCQLHQPYCMVQSLRSKDGIHMLKRECSELCDPGCYTVTKFEHCTDCCSRPLCNVGNSAVCLTTTHKRHPVIMSIFVLTAILQPR